MGLPSRERKRRALALLAAGLCRPHAEESNAHVHVQPPGGEQRLRIGDVLEMMCLGDFLREEDDAPRPLDPVNEAAVVTTPADSGGRRGGRWRRKGAVSSSSPPPRCLLSRWLPYKQFLKCRVSDGEYDDEEEGEVAEEQDLDVVGAVTPPCAGREEAAALAPASGGGQDSAYTEEGKAKVSDFGVVHNPAEQTFLNVGMGASLVFLLTRSITEFNKMTELRREVEILLKEIKEYYAVQKHDLRPSPPNPVESKDHTALTLMSYSDSWGDTEVTQQSNNINLPVILLQDHHPKHGRGHMNAAGSLEYDQLEYAELESELEVLVQLSLDRHDSGEQLMTELSDDKRTELVSDSFSSSVNNYVLRHSTEPKERRVEKELASTTTATTTCCRYQFGVCPHELTRRLHELLEARQEEKITELESALQLARIKLREKEMEASWWRDTARLASQDQVTRITTLCSDRCGGKASSGICEGN